MADREGLRKAVPFNNLNCLTGPSGTTEHKRLFRGLANRKEPPPQNETAAQAGPLNGGDLTGKAASASDIFPITHIGHAARKVRLQAALEAKFPILSKHFGFGEEA